MCLLLTPSVSLIFRQCPLASLWLFQVSDLSPPSFKLLCLSEFIQCLCFSTLFCLHNIFKVYSCSQDGSIFFFLMMMSIPLHMCKLHLPYPSFVIGLGNFHFLPIINKNFEIKILTLVSEIKLMNIFKIFKLRMPNEFT